MPQPGTPSEPPLPPEVLEAAERLAQLDPEPPPPPPPPPGPDAEIHTKGPAGGPSDLIDGLGRAALGAEQLDNLTALDLAEVIEMCFLCVAMVRGQHWILERSSSLRIGEWMRRSLDQNAEIALWIKKYFPPFITLALLLAEGRARWEIDRQLAAERATPGGSAP